jgi:NADPH2:quinone reductase
MRSTTKVETLPPSMRAVRQHDPGGSLVMESLPLPEPGHGEVLVRMHASPINPSDLASIRGESPGINYPSVPGLEGSGIVVKAGKGLFPALRKGKRVACTPVPGRNGAWAEYMVTSAMRCVPLPSGISMEQGSMMLINPMTALAFIELAKKGKHRAMVNNAAASSLGKMLIRLSGKYNLPLINIVRKETQVRELEGMGAEYVLNSSERNFPEELGRLGRELGATLILDAVNGEQASLMLEAAPRGSRLVVYARLSGEQITLDPGSLIRQDTQVSGFYLGSWLDSRSLLFKIRLLHRVGRMLPGTLASHIRCMMPLEKVEEAITLYTEHMSAGKVILVTGRDLQEHERLYK